jgi:hypothetical protein
MPLRLGVDIGGTFIDVVYTLLAFQLWASRYHRA